MSIKYGKSELLARIYRATTENVARVVSVE